MKKLLILNHDAPLDQIAGFTPEDWEESPRFMFGTPENTANAMSALSGMDDESHDAIFAVIRFNGHSPSPDELLPQIARVLKADGRLILHISPAPSQKMCNSLMRFMQANWFPTIGMADDDFAGVTAVACRAPAGRDSMKELLARHTRRRKAPDIEDEMLRQSFLGGL